MAVTKTFASINALSSQDKERLRKVVQSINDSMLRASAEKEYQNDALKTICEDLNLDKKLVRRMSKVYYKSNFNNEVADDTRFEEFYSTVINGGGSV